MPITMRRNFLPLDRLDLVTREDMAAVGQFVRSRILERTARGVDAEGQAFAPYSERYAAVKRDELGATGAVDLMVSGEMLRAITYEARPSGVTLYFAR